MLEKYRAPVAALDTRAASYLREYFNLSDDDAPLFDALHAAGLSQADVVLAMLRDQRMTRHLHPLVQITHLPGFTHVRPLPKPAPVLRVCAVNMPAAHRQGSVRHAWMARVRRGMTLDDIVALGTPRHIVRWMRRHRRVEFA